MATRTTARTPARSRAASKAPKAPDAIAVLTKDHRDVEALFTTFEGLGDRAHKRRREVVDKMIVSLSQHAGIEETVFYPACRERAEDLDDDVLEALEEHHAAKLTLAELTSLPSEHERFKAKVTVLMESIRHHVKEEEKGLFPQVRKAFSRSELQELGDALRAARASAPTRPHPEAPDTPPGNLVATVLTAPLDVAANLAEGAANRLRDAVS